MLGEKGPERASTSVVCLRVLYSWKVIEQGGLKKISEGDRRGSFLCPSGSRSFLQKGVNEKAKLLI